ncbi:hypothetical protein FOCC_FOCC007662 [Frankliniella occidentalis]|nr:hypothetical protein FOCC_FOCC007662 [Frankliniella occidentalis]
MEEERILEKEQWKAEVSAVIHDIKNHVLQASISSLDATDDCTDFCIQMSKSGFVIAGNHHNISNIQSDEFFETPYSLLDKISPKYRESFAQQLIDSLTALTK